MFQQRASMRQGHNNKRMRGRNRKGPNPLARSYESNGPDVKIRGTALHIAEKYIALARDAASSGDRVAEQNYLQHAEHYYRIVAAAQAQMPQQPPMQRADDFDDEDDGDDRAPITGYDRLMGTADNRQPQFGLSDPQPFVNGNTFNGHGDAPNDADGDEADLEPSLVENRPQSQGGQDRQGQYGGATGEQHYRQRGRRAGRGRRRPEGGQDFAQGPQLSQVQAQTPEPQLSAIPAPVAATDD